MNDVTPWYEAFDKNNPALIDKILSPNWVDIPAAPHQPAGPAGAKAILAELWETFPDFKIKIEDTLYDGNKVIVRSMLTGTQKGEFLGVPAKNGKLAIQAIDIHEFKDGKILRTWHTEDWLTGLHQMGAFDK